MSGGGEDRALEFQEREAADKNPKDAKFTTKHGSQGVTNPAFEDYAKRYPDLQADYEKNWAGKGVSLAEYGAMHYASHGKKEGRNLSGPAKTHTPSGSSKPKPKPKPKPDATVDPSKKYPVDSVQYEGPAPQDWRTFDPTPVGIEQLEPLMSEVVMSGPRSEVVENRVASLVDTNSPLFRAAAGQAMRRMNASGLANSSMAQEAVMDSILQVAIPIATADAKTFNQQRMLNQGITNEFRAAQNAAFFSQMQARLSGAINETLQHIAGGYALTQTKINDLTKRYGIDVGAATQIYGIDVGAETQRYVADLQFQLGMEGIEVDSAKIMANIQDNPDAASYIWDLIYGNNVNPSDWYNTWVNNWQQGG
tara:strand:+ start:2498 stop:3592 length:1095 start_codon:yes stop_codon:yes gene_type:complete